MAAPWVDRDPNFLIFKEDGRGERRQSIKANRISKSFSSSDPISAHCMFISIIDATQVLEGHCPPAFISPPMLVFGLNLTFNLSPSCFVVIRAFGDKQPKPEMHEKRNANILIIYINI